MPQGQGSDLHEFENVQAKGEASSRVCRVAPGCFPSGAPSGWTTCAGSVHPRGWTAGWACLFSRRRGSCGWCGLSFGWRSRVGGVCRLGTLGAHGIPGRFSKGYGWFWCLVAGSRCRSALRSRAVLPVQTPWRSPSAAAEDRNRPGRARRAGAPAGGGRRQRRPRIATLRRRLGGLAAGGGGRRQRRPRIATARTPPPTWTASEWRSPSAAAEDRNAGLPAIADTSEKWRSPSAAAEDRNTPSADRIRARRGWRSPSAAAEDRNSARRRAVPVPGRWRSPSAAAEDRNFMGPSGGQVVGGGGRRQRRPRIATGTGTGLVGRKDGRGGRRQRRPRIATPQWRWYSPDTVQWRSPSAAAEDRTKIALPSSVVLNDMAVALDGG